VAKGGKPAGPKRPDVRYVPSSEKVVEAMLDLAFVREDDVVYDLGCGDGRIPIAAARRGVAKAVCVEIDPALAARARARAEEAGVTDRVTIVEGDLFEVDFSDATVVTLYLLPELNLRLRPKLLALTPGARIVSHSFDMGEWRSRIQRLVDGDTLYVWAVPAPGTGFLAQPPQPQPQPSPAAAPAPASTGTLPPTPARPPP
jgi:SAM-dependent methyltransferase